MSLRDLIQEEHDILDRLGEAANLLGNLPASHQSDLEEFYFHIRACQNIVLARPAAEYIAQESVIERHMEDLRKIREEAQGEGNHDLVARVSVELARLLEEDKLYKEYLDALADYERYVDEHGDYGPQSPQASGLASKVHAARAAWQQARQAAGDD